MHGSKFQPHMLEQIIPFRRAVSPMQSTKIFSPGDKALDGGL